MIRKVFKKLIIFVITLSFCCNLGICLCVYSSEQAIGPNMNRYDPFNQKEQEELEEEIEIFNKLKIIHPEINYKIDSDEKKLAFVCFYLYDLLSSKKSSSGMQSFNLITYLYYNNIRNVISRAMKDLYQINLESINLGEIGDGFNCIYELSYYLKTRLYSDLNNEFSIEMSASEIEEVFYENNLYQLFKPILNDDNFHEVTQEKYFELRMSARFDFK